VFYKQSVIKHTCIFHFKSSILYDPQALIPFYWFQSNLIQLLYFLIIHNLILIPSFSPFLLLYPYLSLSNLSLFFFVFIFFFANVLLAKKKCHNSLRKGKKERRVCRVILNCALYRKLSVSLSWITHKLQETFHSFALSHSLSVCMCVYMLRGCKHSLILTSCI
jgi:hypothetical protein